MSETKSTDHRQARLDKLEALARDGRYGFSRGYGRTHTVAEALAVGQPLENEQESEQVVSVTGRLMTLRRHGKLIFGDLQDATGRIQLFVKAEIAGDYFDGFDRLDLGDWVGAGGKVVRTKRGEVSVLLMDFQLLTKSLQPLPEKFHGLKDPELRHRRRYLDLIANPEVKEVFDLRIATVRAVREFMQVRGFVEVETPMLQPVAGGALAKPFKTFHEALGIELYLRIAPELYLKRLVIGGFEKVFEINRNFRNEGISYKDNPEFTMLEAYEVLGDYLTMASLLEQMCFEVAKRVIDGAKAGDIDFTPPFRRARLIDLVAEAGVDVDSDLRAECQRLTVPADPKWPWGKLLLELYEKLVEPNLKQPTFVLDYPRDCSPLAMEHRSDPRFTEHLDLVIGGMEVGVAYSELTDPIDQRKRFEDQARARQDGDDEAHVVDEDFILALEHGMPPTGGIGFGIDRFVVALSRQQSIRDVILFPAMRPQQ